MLASITLSCASSSREGLPPDSPFRESAALPGDLLPQGIAVGDVTSHGALLWVRTGGPAMVQIEWAPPSVWEMASKMATVVAPVSRTARLATTAETDYTLSIPLEGLVPATRYRYHALVGQEGEGKNYIEAKLAGKGEFTTLPDATPNPFADFWRWCRCMWCGTTTRSETILLGRLMRRCRRAARRYANIGRSLLQRMIRTACIEPFAMAPTWSCSFWTPGNTGVATPIRMDLPRLCWVQRN
ncbi:MAG: PhoD-like phosphatase N-terminal domain-containing protein [Nitrospirae bacterium]|nr:PhoD-like phosphatase N-terminal domain-containing protein [Nitrospirota bacterium]